MTNLYIPKIFDKLLLDETCWIAGGAPLTFYQGKALETYQDIDIYYDSEDAMKKHMERLTTIFKLAIDEAYIGSTWTAYHNYILIKYKLNIIGFSFSAGPQETIDGFDLTNVQVAIDHNKKMYYGKDTKTDIAKGEMNFVNFEKSYEDRYNFYIDKGVHQAGVAKAHTWKTIKNRVEKYANRGWTPGWTIAEQLLAFE